MTSLIPMTPIAIERTEKKLHLLYNILIKVQTILMSFCRQKCGVCAKNKFLENMVSDSQKQILKTQPINIGQIALEGPASSWLRQ